MKSFLQIKVGPHETMIDLKPEHEAKGAIITVDYPRISFQIRESNGTWHVTGVFGEGDLSWSKWKDVQVTVKQING